MYVIDLNGILLWVNIFIVFENKYVYASESEWISMRKNRVREVTVFISDVLLQTMTNLSRIFQITKKIYAIEFP